MKHNDADRRATERNSLREAREAALTAGDRVVEQIKRKQSDPPKQ
jgi:hypothetical protein